MPKKMNGDIIIDRMAELKETVINQSKSQSRTDFQAVHCIKLMEKLG